MKSPERLEAEQRHRKLAAEIRRHDEAYYIHARPAISDQEYDRLYRELIELEKEHPHLKETLLSAMGNIQTGRLLDPRFLDLDGATESAEVEASSPFAIVD